MVNSRTSRSGEKENSTPQPFPHGESAQPSGRITLGPAVQGGGPICVTGAGAGAAPASHLSVRLLGPGAQSLYCARVVPIEDACTGAVLNKRGNGQTSGKTVHGQVADEHPFTIDD